jgi:hypothetical protein
VPRARRAIGLTLIALVAAACSGSGTPSASEALKDPAASAGGAPDPAASMVGTWRTGPVPFSDIELAITAEQLPAEDFETWAEDQQLAPWPEDPAAPSTLTMELTLNEEGTFMVVVEANGERLGIAEQGSWTYDGENLNLATGAGLVNHVLLTPTTDGDRMTFTVLDIQEADHDAAYAHLLNALALYASGLFTRTD